jgi:predicted XRE-type DNA-binding protein
MLKKLTIVYGGTNPELLPIAYKAAERHGAIWLRGHIIAKVNQIIDQERYTKERVSVVLEVTEKVTSLVDELDPVTELLNKLKNINVVVLTPPPVSASTPDIIRPAKLDKQVEIKALFADRHSKEEITKIYDELLSK